MKIFSKVLLAGTLALGGLAAMNVETPKIHADEASEYCRYICGPKETLNNFTIQLSDTKYRLGQNIILRATMIIHMMYITQHLLKNTMILVGIIMTLIFTMVHYYQLEQMYMKILMPRLAMVEQFLNQEHIA